MINTRKNKKSKKNQTKKRITKKLPILKKFAKDFPFYASKKFEGNQILQYTEQEEKKNKDHCLLNNSNWFGNLEVAKSYRTKDTKLYQWKIKKPTFLLKIDPRNEQWINHHFLTTPISLSPTIIIPEENIKKIKETHPYLYMSANEKALFEFQFVFGYMTVKDQYEFLLWLKYLIKNEWIDLKTREGSSILKKINIKIYYYKISSLLPKKEKYNRLSFYSFDKHAIMNLCKIVNQKKYNISGVYQSNDSSFWFPNLIVYKMNIEEYILFNPHKNLIFSKEIL